MLFDRKFISVIAVGIGFMFIFMAFQTAGNIEETIITSIKRDDPNFTGSGYTSLCIIYATLSIFNWIAPSVISVIGPKISMLIGSVTYLTFIMTFIWPKTWMLYTASGVIGAGAALIWTGQGNYLTLNSTKATISRNSGIFWALLQSSMFFGNLFVFIKFNGQENIEKDSRIMVMWVLSGLALAGVLVFIILPRAPKTKNEEYGNAEPGPWEVFKSAMNLFWTPQMMLLSITFFYSGIELGFYSGVYGTAVGQTQSFQYAKELVGLSGVFIGIGEILGGLMFGIMGKKTTKWGRDPIVIAGFLIHILAYFGIFLNLPNQSTVQATSDEAFIKSSQVIAMGCSFLLGLGDACFNTQFYSIIGSIYQDNSAAAFGVFKFVQSVAAAIIFFYSSQKVPLYIHLGILVGLAVFGTASYVVVEWKVRRQTRVETSSEE